jgi:uncharacterized protein YcbK (DUF882 family)
MQLTENFNLVEFACKDGTQVPENLICNVQALAENLQVLRDHLGEPVRLNSGYRTQKYNARIGGAPKSQHLLAKAADITVKSKTPKQVKATIEKLIKAGKMKDGGIGLYAGFVHYDVGPVRRW